MRYLFFLVLALRFSSASCSDGHLYENFNTSNSLLTDNTIRVIKTAPDSSVWIGSDYGLAVYLNDNWTIYQSNNSPLPDDGIRSIVFDENGKPWIGTFQGGVTSIQDTGWLVYDMLNSPLPDNHIRAIDFDTAGHLWLGTIGGVATLQDTGWTFYNNSNAPFTVNNVASIFINEDDTKYFGTVNGGLLRLQNGVWSRFDHNNSTLPDNTVLDITFGPDSSIWLAQPAGGLTLYTPSIGFNNFNTLNSDIPSNTIRNLYSNSSGTLYAATGDKGVIKYIGNDLWTEYSETESPDTNLNYLTSNDLLAINKDLSGNLWIGTNGQGLVKLNYVTDTTSLVNIINLPEVTETEIYPNPFTDAIFIKEPSNDVLNVAVLDIAGDYVAEMQLAQGENKIPLSELPRGTYFLWIANAKAISVQKVIKL